MEERDHEGDSHDSDELEHETAGELVEDDVSEKAHPPTTSRDFATLSPKTPSAELQKTITRISLPRRDTHNQHHNQSTSISQPPPPLTRSKSSYATNPDYSHDLDLEKAPTNTSILSRSKAPASIHGFDLSRVNTAASTYLSPLSAIPSPGSNETLPPPTALATEQAAAPPDGGYGWICVLAVFFINAHTWGINSSYGVFLAHYLATHAFPGATPLDYAFVGALSISCGVAVSPLAAVCSRYCGLTVTLLLGALIEGGSLIAASWATRTWQLFLSQGAGFGVGFGLLFVGSVGVVSQWFGAKRSLANGIATAGSGIGGLIYSLATSAMLERIGQPWTFRVLGILAMGVNGVCAVVLREWPAREREPGRGKARLVLFPLRRFGQRGHRTPCDEKAPAPTPTPQQPLRGTLLAPTLLKSPAYLLLLAYATLSMLGYIALLFSLSSYARSRVHISASRAALLTALLNLAQGFGRPTVGLLSDKVGRTNMAAIGTFLSGALAMIVWTNAHGFPGLVVFSLLEGSVIGTFWATIAPVTAEVVGGIVRARDRDVRAGGGRSVAVARGGMSEAGGLSEAELIPPALNAIWLALVLPCTFSAPIAFRLTVIEGGGYLGCQLFSGAMMVGAAGCMWGIRAWRVGVDEDERGEGDEDGGRAEVEEGNGNGKEKGLDGKVDGEGEGRRNLRGWRGWVRNMCRITKV